MLEKNEDGIIVDLIPKIEVLNRNLLEWRKPTNHPCDAEHSILVAEGFGGRYSIQEDLGWFLLWLDDDEFSWEKFETIAECKRYAECRFQKKVRDLFAKLSN
jgi:hypothetical protein